MGHTYSPNLVVHDFSTGQANLCFLMNDITKKAVCYSLTLWAFQQIIPCELPTYHETPASIQCCEPTSLIKHLIFLPVSIY